jgi:hypothetical protein
VLFAVLLAFATL